MGPRGYVAFQLVMSTCFAVYLHRAYAAFLMGALLSNKVLVERMLRPGKDSVQFKWVPGIMWAVNMGFLVSVRYFDGFHFSAIAPWLAFLDGWGQLQRWQIVYNMVMLRMISYAMDFYWAVRDSSLPSSPLGTAVKDLESDDDNTEVSKPVTPDGGSYKTRAYILYLPLYAAGPIITFNSFVTYVYQPQKSYSIKKIVVYAVRWALCLTLMSLYQHFCWANIIAKGSDSAQNLADMTGPNLVFVSLFSLFFIWLKFVIIWRFFRLWALCDGVETPENMTRCVFNNYSCTQFWRSWHRSYNQWLIRYIYIPLGGTKYKFLNIWVVFTFVAVWHELQLQMLQWAWAVCAMMIPEIIVSLTIQKQDWAIPLRHSPWYKYLCALGAAMNILLLMSANLIGFSYGSNGLHIVMNSIKKGFSSGPSLALFLAFLCAAHVMLYVRQQEALRREPSVESAVPMASMKMAAAE
ncbi:Glycerol uptake protein, putative [Perkinsus marinus ATCC 50983]|uniref:Glycerol uptake protein, putative n=1 Tax=Perkinsus marinus (strain ATCC 50983 / TXsc) TaxID=423536 RepID=C5LGY2_PERM5|nr:Glycerol uptake protein, putative [Perkinsus marinus ATCC 50983]EER04010.1 Glycerol uptake protein, putative [Perkinsus marinus ATCC 50983]|eukprot:XP_002772194.1 Glycerol uptake protein, putative [Perkinsus marinus ATCC 50983]